MAAGGLRAAIEKDVVFGTAGEGGRELRCNVYRPPAEAPGFPTLPHGRRVGVLIIHGGAWMLGDRSQLDPFAKRLSRAGYVCVCNEYRLAGEAKWPAMLHDCKACVRWMRANAEGLNISPDHICVEGNSAGGHLALLVAGCDGGLYPELEGGGGNAGVPSGVAACVSVYPPTEMARPRDTRQIRKMPWFSRTASDRDFMLFSPLSYVRPTFPPCCLLHGNGDELVSTRDVIRMYEELQHHGAHAELHIFGTAPHAFDADPTLGRDVVRLMGTFLDRIFRPEGSLWPIDPSKPSGKVSMGALGAQAAGLSGGGASQAPKEAKL